MYLSVLRCFAVVPWFDFSLTIALPQAKHPQLFIIRSSVFSIHLEKPIAPSEKALMKTED